METLYLVTHTEATHHIEGRVGGWYDSELTDAGRAKARQIANELAKRIDVRPDVYSSDLRRAVQTAEPIAEVFSSQIKSDPDLREVSCGIAEGKSHSWLDERIVLPPHKGNRLDHQICDEAESRHQAATRIYRFIGKLITSETESAIVVCHGFATSFAIAAWLGIPMETLGTAQFSLASGSITKLDYDPRWGDRRLVSFNEILPAAGMTPMPNKQMQPTR